MEDRQKFMNEALKQAEKAFAKNEIPIGAVIVYNDKIIAKGYNVRNRKKDPLGHAELIAIKKAAKKIGDWRLEDCTMYVTVEPCPMCAGAIVQARMKKVVYGCNNLKAGSCGSIINILNHEKFNHSVDVEEGIMRDECSNLMSKFFSKLRENNKKINKV